MPQIGWFEILIIVAVAIVIIGPKDFPIMLKKVGSWIGTAKRYINDVQKEVSNLEDENIDVNPETNNLKKKFEDKKDD
ncbi:Sec-independent protein translocase protein TatB [Candidatus Pelagibacter sp.]|nr:Sec-independent protein translocase protein TatB [Candidatus Pelagibacter sp.]